MSSKEKRDRGQNQQRMKTIALDLSLNRGKKSLKLRQSKNSKYFRLLIAITLTYQSF